MTHYALCIAIAIVIVAAFVGCIAGGIRLLFLVCDTLERLTHGGFSRFVYAAVPVVLGCIVVFGVCAFIAATTLIVCGVLGQ